MMDLSGDASMTFSGCARRHRVRLDYAVCFLINEIAERKLVAYVTVRQPVIKLSSLSDERVSTYPNAGFIF
jgi:hypothetical protein